MTAITGASISGLASGLDTASIISSLMQIEKQPQVRIQQKITQEQARQQSLKDVLSQLNSLTTAYQSLTDVGTWADVQSVVSTDDAHVSATRTAGAAAGSYSIDVTNLARANQFTGSGVSAATADDTIHITNGSGTTDVEIKAGDTLDTIAGKINGTTDSPVYATVFNGSLVLSNKSTGLASKITGVTTGGTSGLTFGESQTALDASFKVNGTTYTRSSNVVGDVIPGLTVALKGAETGATITIGSPAPDTDAITKKLQSFVTQYNTTLEYLLNKVNGSVPATTSGTPATQDPLHGDPAIRALIGQLRNSFSDIFQGRPGTMQSLAQAGLSTGKATGAGSLSSDAIDGKLTLDSATFSTALTGNFSNVKALFTNATGSYATEGLGQRLGDLVKPWTASSASNGLLNLRIDSETSTISTLQKQSTDWDVRLQTKQQMLQMQFTAMEVALSKSQSQSSWLDGQIAQLQKG
jgi:flagellar hook-associated protein 2